MKKDSQRLLIDDILAESLANSRRTIRWSKGALVTTVLLTCAALIFSRQDPLHESFPQAPVAASIETPSPSKAEPEDEFDPLLDHLAEAGPILITLPNGERKLVLTR